MQTEREKILSAVSRFLESRPGFDLANYHTMSQYRADQRPVQRALNDGRAMLAAIGWRESITAEMIAAAMPQSSRLSWDGKALSYCAGQYYPTEYRNAVCRALAYVLWDYFRSNMENATGDKIRAKARQELGASIARRWFR